MNEEDYKVITMVTITPERVADVLRCALEGGSTYWCKDFKPHSYPEGCLLGHEAIARGEPFNVGLFYGDDYGMTYKLIVNSRERIAEALQDMQSRYRRHFEDVVNENEDANTGDILFQLLCFGEVVYG